MPETAEKRSNNVPPRSSGGIRLLEHSRSRFALKPTHTGVVDVLVRTFDRRSTVPQKLQLHIEPIRPIHPKKTYNIT